VDINEIVSCEIIRRISEWAKMLILAKIVQSCGRTGFIIVKDWAFRKQCVSLLEQSKI